MHILGQPNAFLARRLGVPFWVSGVSSSPLEDIAAAVAAVPGAPKPWYQIYNSLRADIAESILRRA